jgi:hypothetical protein
MFCPSFLGTRGKLQHKRSCSPVFLPKQCCVSPVLSSLSTCTCPALPCTALSAGSALQSPRRASDGGSVISAAALTSTTTSVAHVETIAHTTSSPAPVPTPDLEGGRAPGGVAAARGGPSLTVTLPSLATLTTSDPDVHAHISPAASSSAATGGIAARSPRRSPLATPSPRKRLAAAKAALQLAAIDVGGVASNVVTAPTVAVGADQLTVSGFGHAMDVPAFSDDGTESDSGHSEVEEAVASGGCVLVACSSCSLPLSLHCGAKAVSHTDEHASTTAGLDLLSRLCFITPSPSHCSLSLPYPPPHHHHHPLCTHTRVTVPRPPPQASPATFPSVSTAPPTAPHPQAHPHLASDLRGSLSYSLDSRGEQGSPWAEDGVAPGSSATLALAHVIAWAQRELGVSLVQGVVPEQGGSHMGRA